MERLNYHPRKDHRTQSGRPPFSNSACWIDINNHVSGEMAAKYLTGCGYSNIAFIGESADAEISRHRLRGFVSAMQMKGITVPDTLIKYGTYSKESGFELMKELLCGISVAKKDQKSRIPDSVVRNTPVPDHPLFHTQSKQEESHQTQLLH